MTDHSAYPTGLKSAPSRHRALRQRMAAPGIVVAPGCYDCISARLVEVSGFDAAYVTGSGVSMSALGAPDMGALSFGEILDRVANEERLEVCLDTAHAFAAGYDLSAPKGAEKTFAEFDRTVGLKRLSVLHLNDSKSALGSRVDRHDNLGKGKIGLETFRWIMRAPELAAIPKILETPKGKDLAEDVEAMALLRGFL